MLLLKDIINNDECKVEVGYYVPFSITIGNEKVFSSKLCWRIGNFKTSLMEISIDEKTGVLRNITLTSVDKANLLNESLKKFDVTEIGTPVFSLEGNVKNGLCDQLIDYDVYLGNDYIRVDFDLDKYYKKIIKQDRVLLIFNQNNQLISLIVKDLSRSEYNDLKEGLKI